MQQMKATEIGKIAVDLLEHLAPMNIEGSQKIAALKSAAAILEAVQNAETLQQALAVHFQNALTPK